MTSPSSLVAVVVLYRRGPHESEAIASLDAALNASPDLAPRIGRFIFDNSPTPSPVPAGWLGESDPSNPGLAHAYTAAFRHAAAIERSWLLLLDQDTVVSVAYLREVLAAIESPGPGVDVFAPKLSQAGRALSPHRPPHIGASTAVRAGVATHELCAFNSGMVLRLDAIDRIGGFPHEFPVDFHDHALLYRLQRHGSKVCVLESELAHDMALGREQKAVSIPRYRSAIRAEADFYRDHHSRSARGWRRVRTLARAVYNAGVRRNFALARIDFEAIWW